MIVEVYIENQRLDLYENDSINVTQNVQNVNDISKIFADFSQSFSVPASDNNNRIFKHYYDADIDNGFDARLLKDAFIFVNSVPFKFGKIRLEDADVLHGKPKKYKITFFGTVINLKELIGDDELSDLDWLDNFNHTYSGSVVKGGLEDGIDFTVDGLTYQNAIVYPLISYTKQYLYNSNSSDQTDTGSLVNIAYNNGRTQGVDYKDLKPSIRMGVVIKAITEKYGIPFNSFFFLNNYFQFAYMNLNNSTEVLANGYLIVEDRSSTWANGGFRVEYLALIEPDSGFENTPYKVKLTYNDNVVYESQDFLVGDRLVTSGNQLEFTTSFSVKCEVITEQAFEFKATTYVRNIVLSIQDTEVNVYNNQVISLTSNIRNLTPDIKVFELLSSIFKMFNLVAYGDDDNIKIEDLPNWYSSGQIYDVTQYVDTKDLSVSRGKIYREINFKFEESDQIIADEFRQSNNQSYGDLKYKLRNPDGSIVDSLVGDVLDIEVLFENPICERLTDQNTNELSSIQYLPYLDRELNPIAGNPFLLYLKRTNIASDPIGFNTESTYTQLNNAYLPSHSFELDNPSFNLNFGSEINEYTYQIMPDTLFQRFYSDYISDIFSVKRRLYKLKALLPLNLLNKLRLNDRLIIKNTRYIINKIVSNIVNRMDDLELINDIYDAPLASDTLNNSLFRDSRQFLGGNAINNSNIYYGITGQAITTVDTGDGVGWITLNITTTSGSVTQVDYDLTFNDTGAVRSAQIQVADKLNNPKFTIIQNGANIGVLNFSNENNSGLLNTILIGKE